MNPDEVRQCVGDLRGCAPQILARLGYQAIRPVIDQYIGYLRNQAGQNYGLIPPALIAKIQPFYPVDLRAVRFAFNINTVHGLHITIGNEIYFTETLNFSSTRDARTLYHELQHVVQYARRGGIEPFMTKYVLKSGGSIIRGGNTVDVHDNIDLETDADSKSNEVFAAVGADQAGAPPMQVGASMGNICRTPQVGCMLPGSGPVGSGCWCPTAFGRRIWRPLSL
jgi:Domain of unknown function (DUF4157)